VLEISKKSLPAAGRRVIRDFQFFLEDPQKRIDIRKMLY
jgi:hypothetical protein